MRRRLFLFVQKSRLAYNHPQVVYRKPTIGGIMRVFSKISASMMTVLGVTVGALVASPAEAQLVAEARSVEVHVVVESSGHTVVSDTVEWQVSSGQMTAMAFQNPAIRNPSFIAGSLFAEHASQSGRVPLKVIETRSQEWEFEANPKMPPGTSYWQFSYEGNLINQGLVGKTTNDAGTNLYYFHWNPVDWDYALRYRDIYMTLPIVIAPNEVAEQTDKANIYRVSDDTFYKFMGYRRSDGMNAGNENTAIVLTTPSINQRCKIDVVGKRFVNSNNTYLTLHFTQFDVSKREKLDLLFYVKSDSVSFDPSAAAVMKTTNYDDVKNAGISDVPIGYTIAQWLTSILTGFAAAGTILLVARRTARKRKKTEEALEKLAQNEGILDAVWEAPQLQVGGYGTEGKIARSLHPIEVGLLLGLSIDQIIGMFVQALADQDKLIIKSLEPITIIPKQDVDSLSDIEQKFLACFDDIGVIDNAKLQDFIEHVITDFKDRTWDCDIDATRRYYMEMMYENPDETDPTKMKFKAFDDKVISTRFSDDDYRYYCAYQCYWLHCNRYYTHEYNYRHGLPET